MIKLHLGDAKEAGISPERIKRVAELCASWVADGSTPAPVVLAARHGIVFLHDAWGQLWPESDSPPVLRDTIFGVASVSKPVTATAVMMLIETGKIGIHQPVQKYIPEFKGPGCEKITVRHLLTHTSGLPNRSDVGPLEAGRNGLEREPGTQMAYSNVAYDLLGQLVQRVTGQSFSEFTRQNIFEPLGMKDSTFIHMGKVRERCISRRPGTIFDPAGAPVVVMLADGTPYARIYVPEPLRASVTPGRRVLVAVDGVEPPLAATVRFISAEAAYTPYYALTQRDRTRLSYLAEVTVDDARATTLPVGVSVQVTLPAPAAGP